MEGYLSEEKVEQGLKKLDALEDEPIVLVVDSSNGDLRFVLKLAQKIYEIKVLKGKKAYVYIDENAIGPAAILPFIADEIDTSLLFTWGDIPLGTEGAVPTNILRNQVIGLISESHKNAQTLKLLARAMIDPDLIIVNDGGWKISQKLTGDVISPEGETLVVNQRQLKTLGIIDRTISRAEFLGRFQEKDAEPIIEEEVASTLMERLKKHIPYTAENNRVGRIVIDDRTSGINQGTWIYVKSALEYYRKNRPIFIILELNTPGGEVFASQRISDALKEFDTQEKIPVVAYIDNWAISAGAMLAYSCRFISTVKDGSMGAAEPVLQTQEGMQSASEKVNSALRTDFSNRASFFNRNPNIAIAMVDKDTIVVERFGQIIKLDREAQIRYTGPNPDKVISAEGKLLTLNSKQMMEYGVADILCKPAKREAITRQEKAEGKWPADKELLFHQEFFKGIPDAVIDTYQLDWRTQVFVWLAHPVVASLLFMGLLMGFYIEINSPGFGIPGGIAVACLSLMVLSSFALEAIDWLEVIILLAGVVMIAIDLFLIPSFGVVGGIGIFLAVGGLFAIMIPGLESVDYDFDTQTFNAAGEYVMKRFAWISGGFVLSLLGIAAMAKYVFPKLAPYSKFVLMGKEQETKEGYFAGEDPKKLPKPGTKGKVIGLLRPGGKVLIEGKIYDALSDGEYISMGKPVKVVRLDGSVIVVKEVKE